MHTKKKSQRDGFFQNTPEFFKNYTGTLISANEIKQANFTGLKVAIIGVNQSTATHLDFVTQHAESVKVFQIKPAFVLPQTEKGIHRLISHPLIIKNRRLFNNRVKSLLAIRYLDSQVQEQWLKRQLMPNSADENKVFFKSDTYYTALQRQNCKLITWPIVKITHHAVQSMEGIEHQADIIVTTY